jgi:hypothetical protein
MREHARAIVASEAFREAKEVVERDEALKKSHVIALAKTAIETVVQQPTLEKIHAMMKVMLESSARRLEELGGAGLPTTIFETKVDDSQFLLYSVGPDGEDDRARLVGTYGTDVLMWPPILSLQREARSAK